MKAEFYVYELIDPRTGETFYIGKGKGKRMYQHAKEAVNNSGYNQKKKNRILEIIESGFEVVCNKLHDNLLEKEAFKIEKELIKAKKDGITNISGGVSKDYIRDWAKNALSIANNPYSKEGYYTYALLFNSSKMYQNLYKTFEGYISFVKQIYDKMLIMSVSCYGIASFTKTTHNGIEHIEYKYE